MTKFKILLIGTSLSFIPLTVNAQCVATQDCATLGYTETTCNGGKGVKCPFGNKWACLGANEEEVREKLCQELGFTLTCTGTGYAGGVGTSCNGKYASCSCASGYEWKNGNCQPTDGAHGDLYYCDGKVVGVKTSGMNFYVAMEDLGSMNWSKADRLCGNYRFCNKRKGVLPPQNTLITIYRNKSSLNSLLSANGGTKLTEGWYWSSTADNFSGGVAVMVNLSNGYSFNWSDSYGDNLYVRPVLTSY